MNSFEKAVVKSLRNIVRAYEESEKSMQDAVENCSTCKHITVDVNKEPCRECRWSHTDYWEKRE